MTSTVPDWLSHAEFGNPVEFHCEARLFFRRENHPGANNCACPKFSDGSCVPFEDRIRWKQGLESRYNIQHNGELA